MKRPLIVEQALAGDLSALESDTSYPAFFSDSLCVGVENDDIFFSEDVREVRAAKAICFECPIQSLCLTWAIREQVEGVFGGTTTEERGSLGVIGQYGSEEVALIRKQYQMLCETTVANAIEFFGVNERTIYRWRIIVQNVKKAS